ncbi:RraA family protein [Pedobacter jamesrossensis]|uniref:Uncharacterized protein n=1 Tax=Pedobacter jamesrossensis TaxID=1908238 RepID=A0ABV8NSM6_9SPHI
MQPGDAVLAKQDGVLFIPANLVEHIVLTGEVTALFDVFGQQRIEEGNIPPERLIVNGQMK